MTDSVYKQIIEAYKRTQSVKATSKITDASYQKTRKVLITAGIIETENWKSIRHFLSLGYTPKQILLSLHLSVSTYNAHTPYVRFYPETPTKNALKIREYRKKKAAQ